MPRTGQGSKHPAQQLAKVRQQLMETDDKIVELIPGWGEFTPKEKQFLLLYPYFNSQKETSRYLGMAEDWSYRLMERKPWFRDAMQYRKENKVQLARMFGADLIGKSMMRLDEMLDPDFKDKRTQFEAIKHVHSLTGVIKEKADVTSGMFINTASVSFSWSKPPTPAVIEATAQTVVDADGAEATEEP